MFGSRCNEPMLGASSFSFLYGGLYADLDVFPNQESYPKVSLGLCKMAARAISQKPEWEIEVVVSTQGNASLLCIIARMIMATEDKQAIGTYATSLCRYIYNTTGVKSVATFCKSHCNGQGIQFFC